MATNFVLTTAARVAAPVMAGAYLMAKDQAPTGAWVEVDFSAAPANSSPMQTRDRVVHITTEAALRFAVGPAAPADAGAQMLAATERTIALAAGEKLWIKS